MIRLFPVAILLGALTFIAFAPTGTAGNCFGEVDVACDSQNCDPYGGCYPYPCLVYVGINADPNSVNDQCGPWPL
jgi:hypothetical protein